jgi:hypothetical protein
VGVPPTYPNPLPIPQACFLKILSDIPHSAFKLAFVPHKMIVILPLPKAAAMIQELVCSLGAKGFPGMDDLRQRMARKNPNHYVHVVGHNAPGEKSIPLIVKVAQCIRNHIGHRRVLQVAGPNPIIQILFNSFRRKLFDLYPFAGGQLASELFGGLDQTLPF